MCRLAGKIEASHKREHSYIILVTCMSLANTSIIIGATHMEKLNAMFIPAV